MTEKQIQDAKILLFFRSAIGVETPHEFNAADYALWQGVTKKTALRHLAVLVGQGVVSQRVEKWRNTVTYKFTLTEKALKACRRSVHVSVAWA